MARPGQPTKYKLEYCERLIEHMAQGYSFPSFAGVIGVCFDTLYEWANVHPEFSEAHKTGIAKNLFKMEQIGMLDEMRDAKWIFTMKNRFPQLYRDRLEQELRVLPAQYLDMSDEEANTRILELAKLIEIKRLPGKTK